MAGRGQTEGRGGMNKKYDPIETVDQEIGEHLPIERGIDPFVVELSREIGGDGYERRRRINGGVTCPECGLEWPLIEETEEWEVPGFHNDETEWVHAEYGPGHASCLCGLAFVDTFEGCVVLNLNSKHER